MKCGKGVILTGAIERRTALAPAICAGIVYSAKPIPTGGMFQVKLGRKRDNNFPTSIGFTRQDPDNIDRVPEDVRKYWESKDYWMFRASIASHDGPEEDMSFSTEDLEEGDSIGIRVSENGDVHYYVNGQNKGTVFQHLPQHQDLWGVIFLCGFSAIESRFRFDLTEAEKIILLEEKVSRLEVAVQEKKGGATTPPGGVSRGDSEEIHSLQQETRALASQVAHLTREQGSLQSQNQQLATQLETQHEELTKHFQQQLTDQLAEQKRVIQEEMQQQFQTLLQQVQSLQPSWSIAQHYLQITTQVLGRGAWGEVRVGIYQGTRVAVKKMHDVIISHHNRKLFEREMIIASRVRHPHLVLFIGAVTTGNLTIVSELMETNLRKLLEEKKLKVSNLRPISKDVACALTYLHSLSDPVVHRNVSSANVLLNAKQDGWCAKLGDFGSANFLAKLGTVAPGAVIYSAPEALHPRQQGPKMDVYSFGVLLFEMCVGELIDQRNLQTTRAAVVSWNNGEKKFLGEFAFRCTETSPDKRPNMADFVKQI